ncbi:hypothetical protein M2281_001066 [Mesorhizobium soli]|nr:hypothetical protein [Mesorhizobium soli]
MAQKKMTMCHPGNHTLNSTEQIEVIDCIAPVSRLGGLA